MKLATRIALAFSILCLLVGCTITGNTVRVFTWDATLGLDLDNDVESTKSTKR